ncbi:LOW QUALITY PROTEIN: hypothetical protein Cgig2_022427 [Carnegiea gigantea]|uniref:Uncharacterized protein n=1 Tax=Carnegiea gigantea TaxID=171969 RepID=A0A9Q1JGR9_9CARY|nr:LOW QUALITY PROTEIN: hypothetical protein Cgig2_022427 [Carnegiea gigantea]
MKLHQLRILTLSPSLVAILHVLDVGLKVALYTEGVGRHVRAPDRTRCFGRNPGNNLSPQRWSISQPLPGSEHPLASAPSLSSRPLRPLSLSSASQSDTCTWPLFPPISGAQPQGYVSTSQGQKRTALISLLLVREQRSGKYPRHSVMGILHLTKSAHHRLSLTSAMATCSSSTIGVSAESAVASTARKSIARAWVCAEGSLATGGEDPSSPRDARITGDPRLSSKAERQPDL